MFCNGVVRIYLQIVRIFCHDLTDRSCPRLTPLLTGILLFNKLILNSCGQHVGRSVPILIKISKLGA